MRCGPPAMRRSRAKPRPANRAVDPRSADLLQALAVAGSVGDIESRRTSHRRYLRGFEAADHPRRRPDDQGMLGKLFAFGDDRACADDAATADAGAVHDDRPHPDQRAVLQRAAMQDDVVTDRAILSDSKRKTHIGVAGRIVLHIGILADLDPLIVAAQYRAEPDAR